MWLFVCDVYFYASFQYVQKIHVCTYFYGLILNRMPKNCTQKTITYNFFQLLNLTHCQFYHISAMSCLPVIPVEKKFPIMLNSCVHTFHLQSARTGSVYRLSCFFRFHDYKIEVYRSRRKWSNLDIFNIVFGFIWKR